jgi:hypothetical protein
LCSHSSSFNHNNADPATSDALGWTPLDGRDFLYLILGQSGAHVVWGALRGESQEEGAIRESSHSGSAEERKFSVRAAISGPAELFCLILG